MLPVAESIREVAGLAPDALPDEVLGSPEPLVLRGLVGQWPMVRAGRESAAAAIAYLNDFWLMMWLTLAALPLLALFRAPSRKAAAAPMMAAAEH